MTEQMQNRRPTIAAIATPPGRGGVAIVRVSGKDAALVLGKVFCSASSSFGEFIPRHMHYGHALDAQGRVLDEVLAVLMPGPHSYTGEDVAEIHCHGGTAVVAGIFRAVLDAGARTAGPGDFTRRAFLNDRMDLSQAEAVAELINADSPAAAFMARTRLDGAMGDKAARLRQELEQVRLALALAVDFPEEEVECLSPEAFSAAIGSVLSEVEGLLRAHERTRTWRDGALVVLCGRVNAGKSSLMNALLGRTRAIVTELPGTTRDYLEEQLVIRGMSVRLVDTAGLRESGDLVELEGIRLSRDLAASADLVLLVVDASLPDSDFEEERTVLRDMDPQRTVIIQNKIDLIGPETVFAARERWKELGNALEVIPISARTGQGVDDLVDALGQALVSDSPEPTAAEIVPNLRQSMILESVRDELETLLDDIRAGLPYDVLGVLLETACASLEEITGRIAPDEVLNAIFDSFCIGK